MPAAFDIDPVENARGRARVTPRALLAAAALSLNACSSVEVVMVPNTAADLAAVADCQERARKSPKYRFDVEGTCLISIPGTRVQSFTPQPGSLVPVPPGCHLLATTQVGSETRETYSCAP